MDYDRDTLVTWDREHVWHPFTQMQGFREEDPLIISRGEGVYLYDFQGRRYLDGVSSLWANLHGHRRPELDQALVAQLSQVAHSTLLGIAHPAAIRLARRLASIAPAGLNKVFFSDNGSTAVEVALKIAFQFWRNRGQGEKQRFLKLNNAYHGDTLGAVSVGGIPLFHEIYRPLLFDTLEAPSPYCYRCPHRDDCREQCLMSLEETVASHHQELAALILEPVMQGAAGMIPQPPGYLARVREITRRYDVLLIADEVAVGFGRTGRMFACEHEGVSPDLLCLAKGITGGYLPLAATLATDEVYGAFLGKFEEFKTFFHGHTYTGNPLGAAVGLASLDIFVQDRVLQGLPAKIELLTARLAGMAAHPHVGDIRQRGLMVGIELVADKASREAFPLERRTGHRVIQAARQLGAILRPLGDVIVLLPPLCITPEELGSLCDLTFEAIRRGTE
ncbi:MAG: adenosylmethionine--8-amino-7-oxononanoate transaminase [Syntrophobacterales bacterium]|jgi:adenosylmethionine-8-amino-7-oxononanoate aminotransferase|nr:adenosylmethionine--8-amino-7-oxononanoate transaminase [Syntrophobacterales bacterium]